MTTIYRYLGWGTTDSTGTAKLDHDSNGDPIQHSYTGVGAGEIDVIASLDDTITESSIVSDPESIFDCTLWYDGTTTLPAMIKSSYPAGLVPTPSENGLIMTNNGSNAQYIGLDKESTSTTISDWIDWVDFAFEFELVASTTNVGFQLRFDHSTAYLYSLGGLSQGDIFRVEYTNGVTKAFVNDVQVGNDHLSDVGELTAIRFGLEADKSATIKNIKLYPI